MKILQSHGRSIVLFVTGTTLLLLLTACSRDNESANTMDDLDNPFPMPKKAQAAPVESATPEEAPTVAKTEIATFAGGCFWCVEAVFEQLDGVIGAVSGYTGGNYANPTYEQVCDPARKEDPNNHAEAVQVEYDPSRIKYEALLDWFWQMHDPTTLNRQGADVGAQYRSAIFYHNDAQKNAAEKSKAVIESVKTSEDPVVTQILPAPDFYPAEEYHQDYFAKNPFGGYCQAVIRPKLKKLDLEKDDAQP